MPTKITYYAIVDVYSSREEPAGILRRTETGESQNDEQFGHDLEWTYSTLLYSYERGNMDNQFYEISEDEANRSIARNHRAVTGEPWCLVSEVLCRDTRARLGFRAAASAGPRRSGSPAPLWGDAA
jgi:hypothetical protein